MSVRCKQCGLDVDDERKLWATPVCFACVPKMRAIDVSEIKSISRLSSGDQRAALKALMPELFVDDKESSDG